MISDEIKEKLLQYNTLQKLVKIWSKELMFHTDMFNELCRKYGNENNLEFPNFTNVFNDLSRLELHSEETIFNKLRSYQNQIYEYKELIDLIYKNFFN